MKPFVPPLLPLKADEDCWGSYGSDLSMALTELGRLGGMMENSPKADPFWMMWLLQESQFSNEIEGTYTTLDEILENNAGLLAAPDRREAVEEVANYRIAMQAGGNELLDSRPFSLALIRGLHSLLLKGVRGENKDPGSFRKILVHIGRRGESIENAFFVPPGPEFVPGLLDNLMSFAGRQDIDLLIQAAVFHAQFEMIHPFLDGNGRLGRLLISLFFVAKGLLTKPVFYLSSYLNNNRMEYYNALKIISADGNWYPWISFFINAVKTRARENMTLLSRMNELYDNIKYDVSSLISSSSALAIIDYVFAHPIFTIPALSNEINIPPRTASNIVNKLVKAGLFKIYSKHSGRTASTFSFDPLIVILRNQ